MPLAMTAFKPLKFANAKVISSIATKVWKKSGEPCHFHANFEKMVALPF
jgi:hypothetical protein